MGLRIRERAYRDLDAALAAAFVRDDGARTALGYRARQGVWADQVGPCIEVRQDSGGARVYREMYSLQWHPWDPAAPAAVDWWMVGQEEGIHDPLPLEGSYAPINSGGRTVCANCHLELVRAEEAHGSDNDCLRALAFAVNSLIEWRNR